VSDDVLGVVSLAEQGLGICQTYDFVVKDRLASGQLVELLPQFSGRARPFSLVYAPHRYQSTAARALIDALAHPGAPPS
jgi:DNA-binding transcriptional LysR family regulator